MEPSRTRSLKRTTRPTPGKTSRRRWQNHRIPFESRLRHDRDRLSIRTTMTTRPMNTDNQTYRQRTPFGSMAIYRARSRAAGGEAR